MKPWNRTPRSTPGSALRRRAWTRRRGTSARERRRLRRREHVRLAVDRSGRRERDPADAAGAHRLEHVEGGDGVLLEILARMVGAEADVRIGRQMEHEVAPRTAIVNPRGVQVSPLDERECRGGRRLGEELPLPRREIVVPDDPVPVLQQPIDQVAGDESPRAGDEAIHRAGILDAPNRLVAHAYPLTIQHRCRAIFSEIRAPRRATLSFEDDQEVARFHGCARRDQHVRHDRVARTVDGGLHLHRFDREQPLAGADGLPFPRGDGRDLAGHRGRDVVRVAGIRLRVPLDHALDRSIDDVDLSRLPVQLEEDGARAVAVRGAGREVPDDQRLAPLDLDGGFLAGLQPVEEIHGRDHRRVLVLLPVIGEVGVDARIQQGREDVLLARARRRSGREGHARRPRNRPAAARRPACPRSAARVRSAARLS